MKNSIIRSIETKIETIILSVMPKPKKTYALIYVKSSNRVIR